MHKREKGKIGTPNAREKVRRPVKREKKRGVQSFLRSNSNSDQTERTNARAKETKRNETKRFPAWTHPQSPIMNVKTATRVVCKLVDSKRFWKPQLNNKVCT